MTTWPGQEEGSAPKWPGQEEAQQPQQKLAWPGKPEEGPGLGGYAAEAGRQALLGAVGSVATAGRGVAAYGERPAGRELQSAIEMAQQGQLPGVDAPLQVRPAEDIKQDPLYKASNAFEQGMEQSIAPTNVLHPLVKDVARGFGSVAANIASSAIPGAAPAFVTAQGMGEAADNAVKKGATPEQVAQSTQLGSVAGMTDLADVLLAHLGSSGKALGFVKRVGLRALEGAATEGGQEGVQQLIQNAIAQGVYNPSQDLTEDVPRSILVGALVGGTVSGVFGGGPKEGGAAADQTAANDSAAAQQVSEVLNVLRGTSPQPDSPFQVAGRLSGSQQAPMVAQPGPGPAPVTNPLDNPLQGGLAVQPTLESVIQAPNEASVQSTPTAPAELPVPSPELRTQEDLGLAPNPYSHIYGNLDERSRRVEAETQAIIQEMRAQYEAKRGVDLPTPSPETPISNAPDPTPPSTIGQGVVSDYRPTTTVVPTQELVLGRSPQSQMVDANFQPDSNLAFIPDPVTPPGAVRGRPAKVRIWFDPIENEHFDVTTHHTAQVTDWLDSVHPVRTGDPLNSLMHHAVVARIKAAVPENIQVHILPQADIDRVAPPRDGGRANGIFLAATENAVAPTILITGRLLLDPSALSHTILHESVHAITSETIRRQDSIGTNFRTDIRILMNEAQRQFSFATLAQLESLGGRQHDIEYAFTNEQEFIAEAFSNPVLQHILSNIKLSRDAIRALKLQGKPKTVWAGLVERIRRMLGLPNNMESYTVLEGAIRIGDRIIDVQQRLPGSQMKPVAWEIGFAENSRAMDSESKDYPVTGRQPETDAIMASVDALFGRKLPWQVAQGVAHADRMSWLYKWTAGLTQLTRANPNFAPILRYTENVAAMHREELKVQDAAVRVAKDWLRLGNQAESLSAFIDDIGHMRYRSKYEIDNGIVRHPSQQEVQRLIAKHGLNAEGVALFKRITQMVAGDPAALTPIGQRGFLGMIEDSIIQHLQTTIQDPIKLQNAVAGVQSQVQELRKRPYFPFTNFGRHYVLVKDPSGRIVHAETVERSGVRSAKRVQLSLVRQLGRDFQQRYGRAPVLQQDVVYGEFPQHVTPLLGMPGFLLEYMQNSSWGLTPEQINAASFLQLAEITGMTPILSKRAQQKYYVPGYGLNLQGYSTDLRRSFSKFFFHGAKFYAKSRYLNTLRSLVDQAETIPGDKEPQIARFMRDHLDNTVLDSRGDMGWAKGAIFVWALGYVPAAATQNLTQTPMISLPFLSAKFGEHKAAFHMIKAMTDYTSYRKYGKYQNQSRFDFQAIEYGIRTGRITETQAPELAAMSQMGVLQGTLGPKAQRTFVRTMQGASLFFELAEQFNRRIAYRAALNLALSNPRAKYVDQAVNLHKEEHAQLVREGFSDAQARAIVTAIDAVDQTQYVYSRWDRPRFMRGPIKSTVLVFKKYVQSTFWMLGQNKDVMWRFLIYSLLIGGLKGLPGMEDILSLIKGISAMFGKDFNPERETRDYVLSLFDGRIDPDIVLQGLARRGFGVPALMDLIGSFATGTPGRGLLSEGAPIVGKDPATGQEIRKNFGQNVPFPVLDRSRAVSAGQILPFDLGKMMSPQDDVNKTIADQAQKASGAFFSVGFNMYKAIMDSNMPATDWKRWERAMPRLLGDVSQAFRAYNEGRERTKGGPGGGSTVLSFDPRDTEQMMEILAIAAGYQPLRLSAKWDLITARLEMEKLYDIKRKGLMHQYFEAHAGGVQDEKDKALREILDFNKLLPDYAKSQAIDGDQLNNSVRSKYNAKSRREQGLPAQNMDIPLAREIDRLHPESVIDVRRVR